jgi:hypothetical protein
MTRLGIFVVSVSVLAMGCGPEDAPTEVPAESAGERISQTVIQVFPDGTYLQTTHFITREEQQAQFAEREARLQRGPEEGEAGPGQQAVPTLKIGCSDPNALWLFDQANRQGNQLCLYKLSSDSAAWLDLWNVLKFPSGTWSGAVRSLWAGIDAGALQSCTPTLCYATPYQTFTPWQRIDFMFDATASKLTTAYLHD